MIGRKRLRTKRIESNRGIRGKIRWSLKIGGVLFILWMMVAGLMSGLGIAVHQPSVPDEIVSEEHRRIIAEKDGLLARLAAPSPVNLRSQEIEGRRGDEKITLATSILPDLQTYLLNILDRDTSRYISIVMLDPYSGRILSMVSYDKQDPETNVCMSVALPAASVFKIVTATAAIENCNFKPETEFRFPGGKYTLYKSQLKKKSHRKTVTVSLEDSFAQSINPVFGQIGLHHVGKSLLEQHAEAFGFNREIPLEIPFTKSVMEIDDDPYNWAEVACGFNRRTLITPLHAAMIAGAVVNGGWLISPTIVDQVKDSSRKTIYNARSNPLNRAMTAQSAKMLRQLMTAAVESGTFRRFFRNAHKDPVLSRLAIGGKSGSILSRVHEGIRYDWFAGFASENEGVEKIALSVVVAHDQYIGKRAGWYAQKAIQRYFAQHATNLQNGGLVKE